MHYTTIPYISTLYYTFPYFTLPKLIIPNSPLLTPHYIHLPFHSFAMDFMDFFALFLALPAPNRPPKIIGKKLNGLKVNIAWEQVETLVNESSVEFYKVCGRVCVP